MEKEESRDTTLLLDAAFYKSKKVVQSLPDSGADVHVKGKYGYTPLHFAARRNSQKVVRFLIDAGADVQAKDVDGWTPVHFAARYNSNFQIQQLLVNAGAEISLDPEILTLTHPG